MPKLMVFKVTRTEKDGRKTEVFNRFVEDLVGKDEELAAIGFKVEKGAAGDMTVKMKGSMFPSLIGKGQAITFKLEEAP